jgi:hypothetical protein
MSRDDKPSDKAHRITNCPNCGASLSGRMVKCDFCETQIRQVVSEEELQDSCIVLIESMNETMGGIMSPLIIMVFIGVVILLPVGVYFLTKFYHGSTFSIWGLTGAALLSGMIVFGFFIIQEETRVFKRELKPRIWSFLQRNEMAPEEFLSIARSVLKKGDPLYKHIDRLI